MSGHADFDAGAMVQRLRERINDIVANDGAYVHSLQVILAHGGGLNSPLSFFGSIEASTFRAAIQTFTEYDSQTRVFRRSLAALDIPDSPYLRAQLVAAQSAPPKADRQMETGSLSAWKYEPAEVSPNLADSWTAWIGTLAQHFPHLDGGQVVWVTQPAGLHSYNSSGLLLLTPGQKGLTDEDSFTISKVFRDELVAALVDRAEKVATTTSAAVAHILSRHAGDQPLAPSVLTQLENTQRANGSAIPFLITGETGTGKLAVAREIHNLRVRFRRIAAEKAKVPQHEPSLHYFRCPLLPERARELSYCAEAEDSPTIIVDDLHNAKPESQERLSYLLDRLIPGSPASTASPAKFIFTALSDLDALATNGDLSASLYAQISAVEIVCPTLADRLADPIDRARLLAHCVDTVAEALDVSVPADLRNQLEAEVAGKIWPSNLRDLNNLVLRRLLAT